MHSGSVSIRNWPWNPAEQPFLAEHQKTQRLAPRGGFDAGGLFLAEFQLGGRQVVAQVFLGARADDQRGDARTILEPRQARTRH